MHLSYTEENYLKAIYQHDESGAKPVPTNAIAEVLKTSPAAVTVNFICHYHSYQILQRISFTFMKLLAIL